MPRGPAPRQPARTGRQDKVAKSRGAKNARVGDGRLRPCGRGKASAAVRRCAKRQKSTVDRESSKATIPLAPDRVAEILKRLDQLYPDVTCALTHTSAWELLVATILSAQSTDVNVNRVTPELFRKYPTVQAFAALTPEQLEPDVRSTGFFRNKSKSVVGAAKKIVADFGGQVPDEMDKLLTLPESRARPPTSCSALGSRKPMGVVVDTHVHRISRRLELTTQNDPQKIEQDLMKSHPARKWILFSHQIIWHGRKLCIARKPKCVDCPLENTLPRRRQDLEHGGDAQGRESVSAVSLRPRGHPERMRRNSCSCPLRDPPALSARLFLQLLELNLPCASSHSLLSSYS